MGYDIYMSSQRIKTQISFVLEAIPKKDTLKRLVLQLVTVIGTNEWITQATKHFKRLVLKHFVKESVIRGVIV